MDFKDKKVVITGGGHGIGKAAAVAFINCGAQVFVIDCDDKRLHQLKAQHPKIHTFLGDIAQKECLQPFYQYVHHYGKIDILINNACIGPKGLLSQLSYEEFDHFLAIGLKAPYELSRLFQCDLIENCGNIINIASSRAFQSEPDSEAYASVKGGIVALTHALAMSLAGQVRVNAIAPGWINVQENSQITQADQEAIPVGRVGKAEDVVNMIMFLVSDQGSFITGETITIDGGMSKRMIYHGDCYWKYEKETK